MNISFNQKWALIGLVLLTIVISESVYISISASHISRQSEQLVKKEIVMVNLSHDLKLAVVQVQQWLTDISATRGRDGLNDGFDVAEENARLFHDLIGKLKKIDAENAATYEAMIPVFREYYEAGKKMARAYVDGGPDAGNVMMTAFDKAAEKMTSQVDDFLQAIIERTNRDGEEELRQAQALKTVSLIAALLLVGITLVIFWQGMKLKKTLGHDPDALKTIADNIARGDLSAGQEDDSAEGVYASLVSMRSHLKEQMEEILSQSTENGRIRTALDSVTSPVLMLDNDEVIIFVNQAAHRLFKEYQHGFTSCISGFSPEALLNSPARQLFSQDSTLFAGIQSKSKTLKADLSFGECRLNVVSAPVKSSTGEVIGSVIELIDRTGEINIENEIAEIVHAAQAGDMTRRIDAGSKTGFFHELAVGMNALLQQMDDVFSALEKVLSSMSRGDFSKPLEGNFQGTFASIQNDMNSTLSTLDGVVGELLPSVANIRAEAEDIANNNDQLAEGAQRQAAGLEQLASTMEEITSTVENNADNAESANELTSRTALLANEGEDVVKKAVDSMALINESSSKISEIIGVIDEIAFQTNLLALNASVEAARAGEQGRGFAVVATEVRNLAGRSAQAAKEIKTLIEDSVTKVTSGTVMVNKSGESLSGIVNQIKDIQGLIANIARANREQSSAISDINGSISNIDHLTQNNAALASEVSSSSENLRKTSLRAQEIMRFFKAG